MYHNHGNDIPSPLPYWIGKRKVTVSTADKGGDDARVMTCQGSPWCIFAITLIKYIGLHYYYREPQIFPLMKSIQTQDKGGCGDWEAGMSNEFQT